MMLIRQRHLASAPEGDLHTTETLTVPVVALHLQKTILYVSLTLHSQQMSAKSTPQHQPLRMVLHEKTYCTKL